MRVRESSVGFMQVVDDFKDKKARHPAASRMSDILYMVTGFGTGYLGSMDHPKALGDIVESLIGAVFVDTGFDLCQTLPVCSSLLHGLLLVPCAASWNW
jgi:dsRNA-specific ribonuclease